MVLFLPGYALIAALFIRKDDLDGIERIALSFGLSIAITPLLGLGLNYTPFGIRLTPILIVLSVFTIALAIGARVRRSRIPEGDRFWVDFNEFKDFLLAQAKFSFIKRKSVFRHINSGVRDMMLEQGYVKAIIDFALKTE